MFTYIVIWWLAFWSSPSAIGDESAGWLTGKELDRRASLAISGQWADAPLRPLLLQLAEQQKIAVFVDRRVDPELSVTMTATNFTWEQLLNTIAINHGYGICRLEDVYYFGPRQISVALPSHYEKLKSQLNERRKELRVNWRKPVSMGWQRLSRPRQLLTSLADEHQIELLAGNQIPLDLWPKFDSPDSTILLKSILLVVGFDKWIAISKTGSRMKVVEFPRSLNGVHTIKNIPDPVDAIDKLKSDFRELKFRKKGRSSVQISGRFEQMPAAIAQLISRQQAIRNDSEEPRFTVVLKGQRGSILATIAKQMQVELKYQPQLSQMLADYIELDVIDATSEEIIKMAVKGTRLKYRIGNSTLEIFE